MLQNELRSKYIIAKIIDKKDFFAKKNLVKNNKSKSVPEIIFEKFNDSLVLTLARKI